MRDNDGVGRYTSRRIRHAAALLHETGRDLVRGIPRPLVGVLRRSGGRESDRPRLDHLDIVADATVKRMLEEHAVRDPDGFTAKWDKLIADGTLETLYDDVGEQLADTVYASLQKSAPRLVRGLRRDRRRLTKRMADVWGPADQVFQAANYIGYELGRDIAKSSHKHGPKVMALLGAHGRALRTADEIRHLAISGFHAGATARWRSLHELAVLAIVLTGASPDVSRRYLEYARIENLSDVKAYQQHAKVLGRKPFNLEEVEKAERSAAEVVERWGKDMCNQNGWASPLFPGKKSISFRDLESIADLGHMRPFYRLGNNHIHAGPRAGELNLIDVTPSGSPAITVGATVFGNIAETCHGAMISVHQATAGLVSAYLSEKPEGGLDHLVGLKAQARFINEAGELWGESATRARARGWFTHGPED